MIEGPLALNTRFEFALVDVARRRAQAARRATRSAASPGRERARLALARAGSPLGDGTGVQAGSSCSTPPRLASGPCCSRPGSSRWPADRSRGGSCDVLGPGQLVLDQIDRRMNLEERDLAGAGSPRALTSGNSRDRQPAFAPDASRSCSPRTAAATWTSGCCRPRPGRQPAHRRPGPGLGPGVHRRRAELLWSSDRSGHLEAWIAAPTEAVRGS